MSVIPPASAMKNQESPTKYIQNVACSVGCKPRVQRVAEGISRAAGQMVPPHPEALGLLPMNPSIMWRGEIPTGDVVHTTGPARTVQHVTQQVLIPWMPYTIPQLLPLTANAQPAVETELLPTADAGTVIPPSSVSLPSVTTMKKVYDQIVGDVRRDIVVSFNVIINKEQVHMLSQSLLNAHRKIIEMAHSGVPLTYDLYHPRHMQGQTPLAYCVHITMTLIESPTLAFMHTYHFDKHGVLQIESTFNNKFIKHIIIHFIWYNGYKKFLGNSPFQSLINIHTLAGAATHCVLLEQQMTKPSVNPFTGLVHYNKFVEICNMLCSLVEEEKLTLEAYLQDILDVGPSQIMIYKLHCNVD
ncbi:hypothetical protein EDD22DRAFT_849608 [Suillus occidentalis]|nr:hypothetical protein EDD22DRAFT_849608 [Suillus occidentalis]